MSEVWRVGHTVRRTAGPWTPQVQWLLAHLRAQGLTFVPEPLGLDDEGREVLSYLPGPVGHAPLPAWQRSDAVVAQAAALLRRLHDATADVAPDRSSGWQAPRREPVEVICHGDFAPYNCVFDDAGLAGVIDFDHAHAGPRLWDLAYAAYRFTPIAAPTNPDAFGTLDDQCRRLRLFCDAYGLEDRSTVVDRLGERIAAMADHLRARAAAGDARCIANVAAGHVDIYVNDRAHVERHRAQLEAALR